MREWTPNKKITAMERAGKIPNLRWHTSTQIEHFLRMRHNISAEEIDAIRARLDRNVDHNGKFNSGFVHEILGSQLGHDFEQLIAEGRL